MCGDAQIENGRQKWNANQSVSRHRHAQAYVAVVLSGGYEECGSRGRFRVAAGDVLVHDAFDAHLDRFYNKSTQILNLVVPGFASKFCMGHVDDPDALARAAELDPMGAGVQLGEQFCETKRAPTDWPDTLACDLLGDLDCRLDHWARAHGLSAETLSRGFGKVFGITPATFRAEARAHRAFALITGSDLPLVSIAAATGFADQAHMSRATRALTGLPPCVWRKSNPFKTVEAMNR